jgi:hypothetical protein
MGEDCYKENQIMSDSLAELNNRIREASSWVSLLRDEMGRVIVCQRYLVDRMIVGLLDISFSKDLSRFSTDSVYSRSPSCRYRWDTDS